MNLDKRHLGHLTPSGTVAFAGNRTTLEQARLISRTLGTRRAAAFLRNRGWSVEAAMWALIGPRASLFNLITTRNQRTIYMDIPRFRTSELYKAMQQCGDYETEDDILDELACMLEEIDSGHDPEEVLHERGFEPDYLFDLIDQF